MKIEQKEQWIIEVKNGVWEKTMEKQQLLNTYGIKIGRAHV